MDFALQLKDAPVKPIVAFDLENDPNFVMHNIWQQSIVDHIMASVLLKHCVSLNNNPITCDNSSSC
jgi:hypothetical protein